MNAFFSGFFSVFASPFVSPGDIPLLDPDSDGFAIEPAGEFLAPPTLASSWKKSANTFKQS